jgi:hypothetical protein
MAAPSIVTVNVSLQQAPLPATLQQTGAFISQGATTLTAQTTAIITQMADLTAILAGAKALTTLVWASSVVTATTAAPHGLAVADTIQLTIAGATPSAYNGTFLCTITGASTFTYPLVANPGTETVPGTYTPEDVSELVAMATTYFAQGSQQSVQVLELGLGGAADGVTALTTWLTNNPLTIYSFLVPRTWDANAGFLSLIASYEAPTSMQYFWVTTTQANYTHYTPLMKCVNALIEAPGIPATEFSQAAPFYNSLTRNPSQTNRAGPFAFTFLFGVTPFPTIGNGPLLTTLKAASVNVIGTGAEGGITTAILLWGTMMDGRDFSYWFAVDWTQIQLNLNLSNEIINGSNNPLAPLYINQDGINRLQARAAQVVGNGIIFGMINGTLVQTEFDGPSFSLAIANGQFVAQAVVNAVPFVPYYTSLPGDYRIGKYAGLSAIIIPTRGFIQIVFNLVVTDFIVV